MSMNFFSHASPVYSVFSVLDFDNSAADSKGVG